MLKNYAEKLTDVQEKIDKLLQNLIDANKVVLDSLEDCDKKKIETAKSFVANMSNKTSEIDNDVISMLALHQPEAKDLRAMVSYLKITNEILRASTNTRNFINGFKDVCQDVDVKVVKEYAIPMQKATLNALKCALDMTSCSSVDDAHDAFHKVLINENKTDDLYDLIEKDLLRNKDKQGYQKIHEMLGALRKSEKIADRALGIATLLLYASVGGEIHQV